MMEGYEVQPQEAHQAESDTHYSLIELKDKLSADQAGLEAGFEARDADPVSEKMIIDHYEAIIAHPESFVGQGNNGIVFKQYPMADKSTRCVKCRWDMLMVNNRSRKPANLPPQLRKIKEIETYFAGRREKTRDMLTKGIEYLPENSALREAVVQNLARRILEDAGMHGVVPEIDLMMEIDRSDSGDFNGDVYSASEKMHMIFMDQIPGFTIQDMVYEASPEVSSRLDMDAFAQKLEQIIKTLHEGGVAHRDLTIRNIMIDAETLEPRIIDFGKSSYAEHLPAEDTARDLEYMESALKLVRRFKDDPHAAFEALQEMQKD